MLNIIVVEDHESLRIVTVNLLRQHGYHVIGLECAEDLDELAAGKPADIFIIDLNLPDEDGISLTRRIRKSNPNVGIIMVTARNHLADRILGYESGADMYLPKPVAPEELLATIASLSRRVSTETIDEANAILNCADLVLQSKMVRVSITQIESVILQALARAKNQQLEHWQLIEALNDLGVIEAQLDMILYRLNQKFIEIGERPTSIVNLENHAQLCVDLLVC